MSTVVPWLFLPFQKQAGYEADVRGGGTQNVRALLTRWLCNETSHTESSLITHR